MRRSEEEIREMIDRMSEKIEEDPFYNDVFVPKESSPLYFVKLALKWVLKEAEDILGGEAVLECDCGAEFVFDIDDPRKMYADLLRTKRKLREAEGDE